MRPALLLLALAAAACGPASSAEGQAAGPGPSVAAGSPGAPDGGSVVFEPVDASGDCAGLLPDRAPAAVTVTRPATAGLSCLGGTSEGGGAVAVAARDASGATTWQVYGADGHARGSIGADRLLPQPSGWQGVVVSDPQGPAPRVDLVAFAADGAVASRQTVSPDPAQAAYVRWNAGGDPAGGALVALRSTSLAGNHWSSVTAWSFDAAGSARWPGGVTVRIVDASTEPLFLAGGRSTDGEALVLSQRSASLDVSWLDGSGTAIPGATAERAEPYAPVVGDGLRPALELVPLLDGSLAVRADGTLRRAYPPRATSASPLPPWLAERAGSTVRFTRGGAGYAALPPPGQASADCTQRIDVISPAGRLCGRVVLREAGSSCTTGAVDQGWDGTVVQQSARDPCTYRFWPRLLAR